MFERQAIDSSWVTRRILQCQDSSEQLDEFCMREEVGIPMMYRNPVSSDQNGIIPSMGNPGNRGNRKGCGGSDSCIHKVVSGEREFFKNFCTLRYRTRKNCHVILSLRI